MSNIRVSVSDMFKTRNILKIFNIGNRRLLNGTHNVARKSVLDGNSQILGGKKREPMWPCIAHLSTRQV